MPKYVLSLDPSINTIGWAMINLEYSTPYDELSLGWNFGSFKLKGETIPHKLYNLQRIILDINMAWPITHVVAETPTFFNVERGRIAARMGWTTQLGLIVGYAIGVLGKPFDLISPAVWKGMVPKDVTKKKMIRTFKDATTMELDRGKVPSDLNDHTIDAIMLLHYWLTQCQNKPTGS